MRLLIAIDGPAGSGKSTVARAVATRLGLERLDTGSMYRAVTVLALAAGIDLADDGAVARLARSMSFEVGERFVLNGEDVTNALRSREVDSAVSEVAAHRLVRAELVRRQREWAETHGGGVVEGRDIGTVVFPGADVKIYLTADPSVRASRREEQLRSSVGASMRPSEADVVAELIRRDTHDSTRPASPLEVAEDAIVVDSTKLSVDEVVEEVLSHL